MALGFGGERQTRRERRAMSDHLEELLDLREEKLVELGRLTVDMSREGAFDRNLLSAKADELVRIDSESELVVRGIEEKLTLDQLEELARGALEGGETA
ncbi:MAG: hypothetical protein ACO3ZZ_02995 [Solirubrobacterales bacterium]|jgi:hypothetical protein